MRALGRILQNINLRTVTSVTYSFDPYQQNVRSIRDMLFLLNAPKIIETNPNCKTKVNVKADRSEPNMHVTFKDGHQLIFKTQYLSTMDIAEHLSKLCAEKDPKPTETRSSLLDQTTTKKKSKR